MVATIEKQEHVDPASRLFDEFESAERAFARRYLEILGRLRSSFTLSELEAILRTGGGWDAVQQEIERAARGLGAEWAALYTSAGAATAVKVEGALRATVTFQPGDLQAVQVIQAASLRLIREFSDQQREAVRAALLEGLTRGLNPKDQARVFRGAIGLTAHQVRAVENFRRLLREGSPDALARKLRDRRFDGSILSAIREERGITGDLLDRMVERYRQRFLVLRSETIARTEALSAVHAGGAEAYRQAVADGLLEPESLVRSWFATRDSRTRDHHASMRGQVQPFGVAFISGLGNRLRYPGDELAPAADRIHCRCSVLTRFAPGPALRRAA